MNVNSPASITISVNYPNYGFSPLAPTAPFPGMAPASPLELSDFSQELVEGQGSSSLVGALIANLAEALAEAGALGSSPGMPRAELAQAMQQAGQQLSPAGNARPAQAPSSDSSLIRTTEDANAHFLTQWGDTPFNAGSPDVQGGEDAPYGHSDCVPTSGLMALSALGLVDHPSPEEATEAIDGVRDASLGYDSDWSQPMGFDDLATGLDDYGATTTNLDHNDLSSIDAALENGNPVVAAGNTWRAWGSQLNDQGEYLNFSDPGPHAVCILGKTEDGKYIMADPLLRNGTIEVSAEQLQQFFADGGGNSGAMEVTRQDGQKPRGSGSSQHSGSEGPRGDGTQISEGGSPPIQPVDEPEGSSSSEPISNSTAQPPAGPHAATTNLQELGGWIPLDAPTTSQPGSRSADQYDSVIDQFDVENNPRYTPRVQWEGGNFDTFCNIFVSDVTRAMGAEVPHFWEGQELDANRTADWLRDHGPDFGWRPVSEQEAQQMANDGKPVVVAWNNPDGIGHVGMVRPGEINENGPALAQAGSENLNNAHVRDTFGGANVVYYAHE
jgi:hypothetical protein